MSSLHRVVLCLSTLAITFLANHVAYGGETHPYQDQLFCDRAPGSTLMGVMYALTNGKRADIAKFGSNGNVGACELALRAARNGKVCVEKNSRYEMIDIESRSVIKQFGSDFKGCMAATKEWQLTTRDGFVEFIAEHELEPFLQNMPHVEDPAIDEALHSADTMWYDEASMVFTYQDSFGNPEGPEGLRGNRVGYDVGINSSVPDIRALTEYFQHGKFRFPFTIAAGADYQSNVYVMNFWTPPTEGGKRLPVTYWLNGSHWHWVFPAGTVIGEVLLMRAPDGNSWHVFEIRSRTRRIDSWSTNVFRPFADASGMAQAIRAARPGFAATDLKKLVDHLEKSNTLEAATLSSVPYRKVFEPINGHYDYLPATSDTDLIKSFLRERTFVSAMGKAWKRDGNKVTYAAATRAPFHIVPSDFIGGMLQTSEESCARCHDQTGRPLGQLDDRVVLYGEIWGEDQIFTWHPFDVAADIFSVSDGSRRVNKRMVQAGLIQQRKPNAGDTRYRELPRPYPAKY